MTTLKIAAAAAGAAFIGVATTGILHILFWKRDMLVAVLFGVAIGVETFRRVLQSVLAEHRRVSH